MKKLLILFLAILCISCGEENTQTTRPDYPDKRMYHITFLDKDASLSEIEYEGHKYLLFRGFYCAAMIHSASCWCQGESTLVHHEYDTLYVTLPAPEAQMDTTIIINK